MKAKPKGSQYKNLSGRNGVVYYEKWTDGIRDRFSCQTSDWDEAALTRDLYLLRQAEERAKLAAAGEAAPTVRAFAARYLAEDTAHLSATTRGDRPQYLRENGPLLRFLGDRRLDELTAPMLREWWNVEIVGRGLRAPTGRRYLDVLAALLGYAVDLAVIESSPVGAFRDQLRRRTRTQRGRVESAPGRHVRPIERPEELRRLVDAADAHAAALAARTHEIQQGKANSPHPHARRAQQRLPRPSGRAADARRGPANGRGRRADVGTGSLGRGAGRSLAGTGD